MVSSTMDEALATLNAAFSERSKSIADYILQSEPCVARNERPLLEQVQRVADFDHSEAERLARVIDELGGIPRNQPVPPEVADMNYMSIAYLHRVLWGKLRQQLKRYERRLPEVEAVPDAGQALFSLCNNLRKQIAELHEVPDLEMPAGQERAANESTRSLPYMAGSPSVPPDKRVA